MRRTPPNAVVVVEDDISVAHALDRILRLGGLAPVGYSSAEALLATGIDQAACLIIDVQLPGINGFALRDRLAVKGVLPPVIFISAYDEPEARESAARASAMFLAKPFSGRVLLEIIRGLGRGVGRTPVTAVDRQSP